MLYYKNIVYYFDVSLIDNKGDFVSGQIITYKVYTSNNILVTEDTMIELGTSGIYRTEITFTNSGQYRIEYYTPNKYPNQVETIIVEEIELQSIGTNIIRILGLSQENYKLTDIVHNVLNGITSAKIRIYASANDCNNGINEIAIYNVVATYNEVGKLLTYKVTKT